MTASKIKAAERTVRTMGRVLIEGEYQLTCEIVEPGHFLLGITTGAIAAGILDSCMRDKSAYARRRRDKSKDQNQVTSQITLSGNKPKRKRSLTGSLPGIP